MKKVHIVSLIILVIAAVYLVFRLNSLSIALRVAGYPHGIAKTLERGFNDSGKEFRIVTARKDDDLALVCMEKNNMGFWKVLYTGGITSPDMHLISIGWIKNAGIRRYEVDEDLAFSNEWHNLYYGNNAIKRIDIDPGQLPPGVALNIQQGGRDFMIHLITFEEPEALNQIDIHSLLMDTNSIEE
ncbi:hypothetical protein [Anaerotaenia torta]|uniref:hypothetical protein n=1 Tax=Anaerotaenia torta TaxID=433293 RepID=UPI003D21F497